jgi:tripartite ATP-independent transporter DctP family solute receptor
MTKKSVLAVKSSAIAAAAVFGLVACSSAGGGSSASNTDTAEGQVTLKLAHIFPEGSAVQTAATSFMDGAPEVTDGRVTFELYPGGQLGSDEEMGTSLTTGDLECGFVAFAPSGLDPKLQLSFLPYIVSSYEGADEVFFNPDGIIQTNEREVLAGMGITSIGFYENDFRGMTNNTHPITKPSDLEGLKMRVPGLPMYLDLFSAWGAQPVAMPFTELYTALQQGTVDGQDNGIVLSDNSRFQEVQKYLTVTRHAYGTGALACNTEVWESLSEDDRAALKTLAEEVSAAATQEVRDSVDTKLASLEKAGMEVTELTPAQIKEFAKSRDSIWDANRSVFGDDVIDQLIKESDAADVG